MRLLVVSACSATYCIHSANSLFSLCFFILSPACACAFTLLYLPASLFCPENLNQYEYELRWTAGPIFNLRLDLEEGTPSVEDLLSSTLLRTPDPKDPQLLQPYYSVLSIAVYPPASLWSGQPHHLDFSPELSTTQPSPAADWRRLEKSINRSSSALGCTLDCGGGGREEVGSQAVLYEDQRLPSPPPHTHIAEELNQHLKCVTEM